MTESIWEILLIAAQWNMTLCQCPTWLVEIKWASVWSLALAKIEAFKEINKLCVCIIDPVEIWVL
jgi:hypothetical protein